MKKINRHFAIDKMTNRQMTLRMMIRVFEDMDGLIIHELAHWVGAQRNIGPILDPRDAYGPHDSAAIKVLTPNERVHGAECYANFAFDVATNLPGHYQDA